MKSFALVIELLEVIVKKECCKEWTMKVLYACVCVCVCVCVSRKCCFALLIFSCDRVAADGSISMKLHTALTPE